MLVPQEVINRLLLDECMMAVISVNMYYTRTVCNTPYGCLVDIHGHTGDRNMNENPKGLNHMYSFVCECLWHLRGSEESFELGRSRSIKSE